MNLVRYDAACRALAEAKAVDEVKDVRDKADAMRIYAMQAKNKQLEVDAAEIRIRAERRLGELITAQKLTVGLSQGGRPKTPSHEAGVYQEASGGRVRPTLADVGIDYKLSQRAQALAAVPAEEFEEKVSEWRERVEAENERVTVRLIAAGEKAQAKANGHTPPEDDPRDVEIRRLKVDLADAREKLTAVTDELESYLNASAEEQERQKEFQKLRAYIRTVESQRDDYMAQVAQWKRECKALRKRLGE